MVVLLRIVRVVVGRLKELTINANVVSSVGVQKAVAFAATLDFKSSAVGTEKGGRGRAGSRTHSGLHACRKDAKEEEEKHN